MSRAQLSFYDCLHSASSCHLKGLERNDIEEADQVNGEGNGPHAVKKQLFICFNKFMDEFCGLWVGLQV